MHIKNTIIFAAMFLITQSIYAGEFEQTIHDAVYDENIGLLEWLIEQGHDINSVHTVTGETPLSVAMRHKNMRMFNVLLNCGADINARSINGYTLLHNAAFCHSHKTVRFLLAHGAHLNSYTVEGDTPLHLAVHSYDNKTISLLLHHAQRAGILDEWLKHPNAHGRTPFGEAVCGSDNYAAYEILRSRENIESAIIDYWRGNQTVDQKLITRQVGYKF